MAIGSTNNPASTSAAAIPTVIVVWALFLTRRDLVATSIICFFFLPSYTMTAAARAMNAACITSIVIATGLSTGPPRPVIGLPGTLVLNERHEYSGPSNSYCVPWRTPSSNHWNNPEHLSKPAYNEQYALIDIDL
jgi:hypothetical protein